MFKNVQAIFFFNHTIKLMRKMNYNEHWPWPPPPPNLPRYAVQHKAINIQSTSMEQINKSESDCGITKIIIRDKM